MPTGERAPQPSGLGAWVELQPDPATSDGWSLLSPRWNFDTRGARGSLAVPCVLGGAYACRRRTFIQLGGHLGLVGYGGEEPSLSIRSWLAGGSCQVLTDVEIGHIYRQPGADPLAAETDALRPLADALRVGQPCAARDLAARLAER